MRRSNEQILTTHTGSLVRSDELTEMLLDADEGRPVDTELLDAAVRRAVDDVVRRQVAAGLSVVNDGEQSKVGFAAYVSDRLNGFSGDRLPMPVSLDARAFPEWAGQRSDRFTRPACDGPVSWRDFSLTERDIENLKAATKDLGTTEVFMTAASPGTIANNHPNRYYRTQEEYVSAIAEVMAREYEAIVNAGFILQVDCPDLALRNNWFPDLTIEEFRAEVRQNIEALNLALRNIPPEQVRMHVCFGSQPQPHIHDVELGQIADLLATAHPAALSVSGANGRHEHEWSVWEKVRLPDGKILVPGVIDNTAITVEHSEVVAERIIRYANVVGRENVIAGVDCGFGALLRRGRIPAVHAEIVWEKLRSLAEGAALASKRLWR